MILLDSLYINNSGGLRLLEYLIAELQKSKIEYYLLADFRCMGKFDKCKHVQYMKASLWKRKKFYQINQNRFSKVICFCIWCKYRRLWSWVYFTPPLLFLILWVIGSFLKDKWSGYAVLTGGR